MTRTTLSSGALVRRAGDGADLGFAGDDFAEARAQGGGVEVHGWSPRPGGEDRAPGNEIKMRPAAVLEKRDVGGALAPGAAGDEVGEIAEHVGAGDDAAGERVAELADVRERGLEAVDEDAGAAERGVVGLAHVGAVGADQVEVLAGAEPGALKDRRGGGRRGGDDVRRRDGGRQVGGDARRRSARRGLAAEAGERLQRLMAMPGKPAR